jgi:hypothetical protein
MASNGHAERLSCMRMLFAVVNAVMHLNDSPNHRWTREMIADWVELEEVRLMTPDEIPDPIPTPSEAPVEVA